MAPAHQWGQNFLVDQSVLEGIADLVLAEQPCQVLEIGPGLGALTLTLLERGASVEAIELDGRVLPWLDRMAEQFPGHLHIEFGDALALSWAEVAARRGWETLTIAGNLPYYITAPLIGRLMEQQMPWQRAVFMVQREVADRLLADPGRRASSTLGVLLRYWATVEPGIPAVPPSSFYPAPEIVSSVIQLVPHPPLPVGWDAYRWAVKAGFQHRRKTLRQALAQAGGSRLSKNEWQELLESIDISSSARAEALTLEEWIRLSSAIEQRK